MDVEIVFSLSLSLFVHVCVCVCALCVRVTTTLLTVSSFHVELWWRVKIGAQGARCWDQGPSKIVVLGSRSIHLSGFIHTHRDTCTSTYPHHFIKTSLYLKHPCFKREKEGKVSSTLFVTRQMMQDFFHHSYNFLYLSIIQLRPVFCIWFCCHPFWFRSSVSVQLDMLSWRLWARVEVVGSVTTLQPELSRSYSKPEDGGLFLIYHLAGLLS